MRSGKMHITFINRSLFVLFVFLIKNEKRDAPRHRPSSIIIHVVKLNFLGDVSTIVFKLNSPIAYRCVIHVSFWILTSLKIRLAQHISHQSFEAVTLLDLFLLQAHHIDLNETVLIKYKKINHIKKNKKKNTSIAT